MFRFHSSRLVTALVGALLSAMLLGGSPALAANTRLVCFDTPSSSNNDCSGYNLDGSLKSGVLVFDPVTTGFNTSVKIQIRNDSGSTLNHVRFAGGDLADPSNLPYSNNPLFGPPSGTSFPSGAAVPTFQDASDVQQPAIFPLPACTFSSGYAGFVCDVGSLTARGPKSSATFTIVITPPAAGGHVWLTASWNEGWSTSGSNADYAFAEGDITVSAPSCATGTANYFLPNDPVGLTDAGNQCFGFNQHGSASSGAIGGNGGFGSLGIDQTPPDCPTSIVNAKGLCYGTTVSVTIVGGVNVQWTITWYGIKSLAGVIHYKAGYSKDDKSTYDVIPLTKKFQCSTTLTSNCWVSPIVTTGGTNPSITVTFITPQNGKAGGWT